MNKDRRLHPPVLVLFAAALLVSAADGATSSWTPAVRERMLADAMKVAPPTLAHIILKHPEELRAGVAEPSVTEGAPQHRQDSDDAVPGAAAALDEAVRRAVAAIDGHSPISEVARRLGVVAHFAADLSDPLLTAPGGATAPFALDFGLFVETMAHRFAVVFYGYAEPEGGGGAAAASPREEAIRSARKAREYFDHLERAYAAAAGSRPSFDLRSIPYGVASICYSRAVTGIARAWLHVWRSARGDISGTPHLAEAGASAPPTPAAEPAAGPAARAAPEAPPITKTILGKSRRRGNSKPVVDPNAVRPADPNRTE